MQKPRICRLRPLVPGLSIKRFEVRSSPVNGGLWRQPAGIDGGLVREVARGGDQQPAGDAFRPDNKPIEQADGSYKIADVKVDGLSLTDAHGQEFASVISKNSGSVSALI
ncbi:hypothetical protein [Dongia deserti]|uniref:hypothetical protein n=1 Tax=Dongia deserti TaxID=2268030 RepID=UPI000E65362E|nr:hypothetical protein [Dongia deserti]